MLKHLHIVRDCWWLMPSGDSYVVNESGNLPSRSNTLYPSLNNNDGHIDFHGSGVASYFGRLNSTNYDMENILIGVSTSGDSSVKLYINSILIDELVDGTNTIVLSDEQRQRIFDSRINSNYSYFNIDTSGNPIDCQISKFYLYYEGDSTWDNHETDITNVITSSIYPNQLGFREESVWVDNSGNITDSSFYYNIDDPVSSPDDTTYIEQSDIGSYNDIWDATVTLPNGGLSLYFNNTLDPLTQLTRAQLNLRLNPSGCYQDTFEVHGYNSRYKNQDYRDELDYLNSDVPDIDDKYGYFLYGAGSILDENDFTNYSVELNFLDPYLPSGNLASVYNRTSDILSNMEFQLVGLPSGIKLSATELQVEYISNNFVPLYTAGHVHRQNSSSYVDAGTDVSYRYGNGGWHHVAYYSGSVPLEERVFDNFYTFDEPETATRIYPEKTKQPGYDESQLDTTVYADYVQSCPQDDDEADNIYGRINRDGSYIYLSTTPEKREYYRNPLIVNDGPNPTLYRYMDYHSDPIVGDNIQVFQPYFHDRIDLGSDFTLYFMLYRQYGQSSYGKFFERGPLGNNAVEYEIIGKLFADRLQFDIKNVDNNSFGLDIPLEANTEEPILVWLHCGYETLYSGFTTVFLNVHDDISNYFSKNWKRDSINFNGQRKQYNNSRTILGTIKDLSPTQQSIFYYYHYMGMCEFGYKNHDIFLNYNLTNSNTYNNYDTSSANDKEFLSTRLSNSLYLQNNEPSGIKWFVPEGSGSAYWSSEYSIYDWTDNNYQHSLLSPITTAGTNYENTIYDRYGLEIDDGTILTLGDDAVLLLGLSSYVSPILINLEADHITNHPSGCQVYIDIGFDTPTKNDYYLARTEFTIPSGYFNDIQFATKHINFGESPVEYDDLSAINLLLHTKYQDIGDQEYYGDLTITSVNAYFDSFAVPQTGLQDLDLYLYAGSNPNNSGDITLYTLGDLTYTENIDLYTIGRGLRASGDIPLYINSDNYVIPDSWNPDTSKMNLFIEGLIPPKSSGNLDLYMWATTHSGVMNDIPLIISSLYDPNYTLPLYISAPNGEQSSELSLYVHSPIPTVNNNISLYTKGPRGFDGLEGDYVLQLEDNVLLLNGSGLILESYNHVVPLFIWADGISDGYVPTNANMNLFMARDTEAVAESIPLFVFQNDHNEDLTLFTKGCGVSNSSIPLYISGSGLFNNSMKLYTHGY